MNQKYLLLEHMQHLVVYLTKPRLARNTCSDVRLEIQTNHERLPLMARWIA